MSLRDQAASDLLGILEDSSGGFGWPLTITSPEGASAAITGFSTDIGTTIDPETGALVAARRASVAIPIARLTAHGLAIPRGIADQSARPWVVTFADIEGASRTYKVSQAMPDRALGVVTCMLEAYKP